MEPERQNLQPADNSGASPPPLPPVQPPPIIQIPSAQPAADLSGKGSPTPSVRLLLGLCLALVLADGMGSLLEQSLGLFFRLRLFSAIQGLLFVAATLIALVVYVLMAFMPMIPKRLF